MADTLARWNRFLNGLAPEGPLPSVIVESWQRSEAAGLERDPGEVEFHRIPDDELQRRLETNADWLSIAHPHLEWLTTTFAHIPHVIYLTDRDGIVLHSVGSESIVEEFFLSPGYDWSEERMGTNGAGTALAANQPVAVIGSQHFRSAFWDRTCMGAPIHAPDGTLIGAIDISTSVADGSPERLSIVGHAAYTIAREFTYERQEAKLRETERSLRESEDRLRAILDNTSAVVYLIDGESRFLHINRRWQDVFGLPNELVAGRSIYDFFPQATADQFRDNNRKALESGVPMEFEEAVPQDDGLHTYITVKVPIYDPTGAPQAVCGISTDITDRKRAEQQREAALSTLNNLVASVPLGIALLDGQMRYRLVNGPLAEMNGIPIEEHFGKTVADVVPDLCRQVEPIFRQVLEKGKAFPDQIVEGATTNESESVGKRVWRESWFPVAGPDGRPSSVGVVVQEITEQRQAMEALRESEARFRQLADAMPQIVWVTRPDGYHEYYNQKWYDYIGCSPEECIGHGWNYPLHGDDRQRAIDRWNLALSTGEPYEIEYRFRGRDGRYRWFLARALPVRDDLGNIIRWFGTCTDIEDMKRAEEAIRNSEARYRTTEERLIAALSASDTGTFRWNPEVGTFLDFDDSLKRLFGLTPNDPVRTTDDFINRVHPDDRSRFVRAGDRCRQGADFEMEYRVILSEGRVRWLYDRAKMVHDAQGRPTYLVGACTDITKRKQVEEALREADRRKDEFLATLSHELRNPLAPIRTGLELIRIAGEDRATVEEVRTMMEAQVEQLVRLVDDLQDVSRIASGKVTLRKERVELASIVRSAVDATRPIIEESGHQLTVSLPPEPIVLEADLARAAQILSNLLTNAARYTTDPGHIRLTAERQGNDAVVAVKDTGIGIPADMFEIIFEMFAQVDRSLQRSQSGLGIGLSLVKRLVEMHGGCISVFSEGPGKGSEFTVRLPLHQQAGETMETAGTQSTARPPQRRS